ECRREATANVTAAAPAAVGRDDLEEARDNPEVGLGAGDQSAPGESHGQPGHADSVERVALAMATVTEALVASRAQVSEVGGPPDGGDSPVARADETSGPGLVDAAFEMRRKKGEKRVRILSDATLEILPSPMDSCEVDVEFQMEAEEDEEDFIITEEGGRRPRKGCHILLKPIVSVVGADGGAAGTAEEKRNGVRIEEASLEKRLLDSGEKEHSDLQAASRGDEHLPDDEVAKQKQKRQEGGEGDAGGDRYEPRPRPQPAPNLNTPSVVQAKTSSLNRHLGDLLQRPPRPPPPRLGQLGRTNTLPASYRTPIGITLREVPIDTRVHFRPPVAVTQAPNSQLPWSRRTRVSAGAAAEAPDARSSGHLTSNIRDAFRSLRRSLKKRVTSGTGKRDERQSRIAQQQSEDGTRSPRIVSSSRVLQAPAEPEMAPASSPPPDPVSRCRM
ncbi:unnamed protein product, partial [Protopolystoma xenopodis]